ncbi:MAG: recombinase family protein [Alphaproteobacteria bacterium]|nr:MAG: recombinase family protein [Alphaproteobacteria bacterium]
MSKPATVRCAVYTRKSSEEGLEQEYNSLHAQRDACEAYVKSQVGEGWTCLRTAYDDGGISGGTMDRPGLKQLLADIAAKRIDVVVVYKVDRLTRSLWDFAKIVEVFDAHQVSFVSVTQSFNTTSSMGRLTLNMLLSFAQFEREVTSERIRDKIAASKKKGMWMGGGVPLGYDAVGRTLKINEAEAETVRAIFRRYLELRSVHRLVADLKSDGIKSKRTVSSTGRTRGGCDMNRGALFALLANPAYLGKVRHKGEVYDGLHPAIVEQDLFDAVQAVLAENRYRRGEGSSKRTHSALVGRLFDDAGGALTPTFTKRPGGKIYRYYVASELQRGGQSSTAVGRLPAGPLDQLAANALARAGGPPRAQIERVVVRPDAVEVTITVPGEEHPRYPSGDDSRLLAGEQVQPGGPGQSVVIRSIRIKTRGGRVVRLEPPGAESPRPPTHLSSAP